MLFPYYFNQKPFSTFTVKLIVKNMLPWSQMKLSICNRYNNFTPHDLPFKVCIGIVFISIMAILTMGFFRGKFFQPYLIVMVKPGLIIIDKDRCCYMHSVYKYKSILNAAFFCKPLYFIMNRNDSPTLRNIHPYFFSQCFHEKYSIKK